MSNKRSINVALVGNPNTGKTSLFNQLTGLTQKVGNYPGVTVDKKEGNTTLSDRYKAVVTDLPGTYSINPTSADETIVLRTLLNSRYDKKPDVIVVVADVENLKRNLFLFSQVKDLEIPTVLVINMADQMERKGISVDLAALQQELGNEVVLISVRKDSNVKPVKDAIVASYEKGDASSLCDIANRIDSKYFEELKALNSDYPLYELWLMITQDIFPKVISQEEKDEILAFKNKSKNVKKYQQKETIYRYQKINEILKKSYDVDRSKATDLRARLDKVFTHKIFGYALFFGILLLIFQSIFEWASVPMDFIDATFANFSDLIKIDQI